MWTLSTPLLILEIFSNSLDIALCATPNERNFLDNFGSTSHHIDYGELPSVVPPKERNFLSNFEDYVHPYDVHRAHSALVPVGWKPAANPKHPGPWEFLTTMNHRVKVRRNVSRGFLQDIELAENQQPRPAFDPEAHFSYNRDVKQGLEFIAHLDREENWISLSPVTPGYWDIIKKAREHIHPLQCIIFNRPKSHQ